MAVSHDVSCRAVIRCVLLLTALFSSPAGAHLQAQREIYGPDLLPEIRRSATSVPGDLPTEIRVFPLNPGRIAVSAAVEGGGTESVPLAYTVFQIRFPEGWIVVDAALDRELIQNATTFSDEAYEQIHHALRDATLIVVTHEHHDHVAGVLRSPYLAQVQPHALLTCSQVRSLRDNPNHPLIRLDSAAATRYPTTEYESVLAIAPGVVLVKAAGHTPGSQLVYVRLRSGQEVILAGDVAWHMSGIRTERHKPETSTRSFGGEDRAAIAPQLHWLRDVPPSVAVVVSHDMEWIDRLVARGSLQHGLDFGNPAVDTNAVRALTKPCATTDSAPGGGR